MDFKLSNDLDLVFDENGAYSLQENGETSLITAFFTDARVNEQRGYWVDEVVASELWRYDQSRVTNETILEIKEIAKSVSDKIIKESLFSRVDVSVFSNDASFITMHLQCFNKSHLVTDRKFVV